MLPLSFFGVNSMGFGEAKKKVEPTEFSKTAKHENFTSSTVVDIRTDASSRSGPAAGSGAGSGAGVETFSLTATSHSRDFSTASDEKDKQQQGHMHNKSLSESEQMKAALNLLQNGDLKRKREEILGFDSRAR